MNMSSFVRWWFLGLFLFLPFENVVRKYVSDLSPVLTYPSRFIDEATIGVLSIIIIWKWYRDRTYLNTHILTIALPLIAFTLFGIISGIINGNPMHVTVLGTYDYAKLFLLVFIGATFLSDGRWLRASFNLLLVIACILSLSGIIEEVWALFGRYVLGRNILDPAIYLFRRPPNVESMSEGIWRFGMLRANSLIKNINLVGLFCLFVFTLYIKTTKKRSLKIYSLLLIGILLSLSKMAYSGLAVILILDALKGRRTTIAFLVSSLLVFVVLSISLPGLETKQGFRGSKSYRDFAREKGVEVWKDHKIIGTGPGRFGGIVSLAFLSPIYKQYSYPMGYFKRFGGIDQFWPQLLAELGLIGVLLYLLLLAAVLKVLYELKSTHSEHIRRMVSGLLLFTPAILIFTLGTGFNVSPIILPFFSFLGASIALARKATPVSS